jgi:hypothetical protein
MITKTQLRDLKDSNNQVKHMFEIPWNETSLSRLYEKIDAQIEGGALLDIVKATPISFDSGRGTLMVEMVLDCSDLFEENEEEEIGHLGDGE